MTTSEDQPVEPGAVRLVGHANLSEVRITGNVTLRVARIDNMEIEDSDTQKVLRLRNGDFLIFKSVYLVVDGERIEITVPVDQTI